MFKTESTLYVYCFLLTNNLISNNLQNVFYNTILNSIYFLIEMAEK